MVYRQHAGGSFTNLVIVEVQTQLSKMYGQLVAGLSSFDVKRSGKRIARLRPMLALIVLSARIEGPRENDLTGPDMVEYGVCVRERVVILISNNLSRAVC